ncbi:isochorismate synthase [Salinivibrio sp. IB868]|uniref:isochorismate synthase n=1 Tax=unclassified Salinivibrio TaxID=2636825 RepID=UPI0009875D65|nr:MULTISPECIES: isochorismate synthase MenF [unclassified Salinivibrio]OOE65507.1 isochorismate synthase [Salinivibrio sp. IB868]OOE72330.1 isochorismate synthase [Salinivibrio sp. IB870]
MQHTQRERLGSTPVFSPDRDLFFSSEYKTVSGKGISQTITTPAIYGEQRQSAFQQKIQQAFADEKSKGVENPILMGSIPFDVSEPSCLYIPESVEVTEHNAAMPEPNGILAREPLQILAKRSEPDESLFKHAVAEAVKKFQRTELEKAVLSRVLNLELSDAISADDVLSRLIKQNPTGFHFAIPQQDQSVLLGASPELLIRQQGTSILSNPLAGSAKRQGNTDADRQVSDALLKSVKDRYEHRLVIEEIAQQLTPYCRELDVPTGPSLISTPTMWHLSTRIEGQLNGLGDEQGKPSNYNVLQLACLLHPTPAVCGFPFTLSRDAIKELEGYERGMFTGMVGWCDSQGNGEWAVTIRCGKVRENSVRLFAGAGIVDASCPQAEWAETEAKLGTMLNAFGLDEKGAA